MRIFGTPDTFVESSSTDLKLGRLVANFDFLRALLKYGDFDAYHIFCPTQRHIQLLSDAIQREIADESVRSRIMLLHHMQLPGMLKSTRYTVFHVGGWYFYTLRLAYLRSRWSKNPFVLTGIIHSLNTPDIPDKMRDLIEAPMCAGDAIVCTSQCGKQVMANYERNAAKVLKSRYNVDAAYKGQWPVIPLAVSDDWLQPQRTETARTGMGFSKEEVVLLYMGRMSVDKKGDLVPLLYVLRRLNAQSTRTVRLVLSGGVSPGMLKLLQTSIQELNVSQYVLVLPNVSDQVKRNLYAAADIFVSPIDNLQETFGISVVEAMAAGLPVVASGFDGYRELVVDGVTGFLTPTLWCPPPEELADLGPVLEPSISQLLIAQNVAVSVQGMEEALLRLIQDPSLRREMGEQGRNRAREKFTWQVVIRQYQELWAELATRLPEHSPESVGDASWADLYEVFEHYPTHLLSAETTFVLTDVGRSCIQGSLPMPRMYAEMAPFFQSETIRGVVQLVANGPVTWATIAAHETLGGSMMESTRFHVLWLVKYGLLDWRERSTEK